MFAMQFLEVCWAQLEVFEIQDRDTTQEEFLMELQMDLPYLQGMQGLIQQVLRHKQLFQELQQGKYIKDHLAKRVHRNSYVQCPLQV